MHEMSYQGLTGEVITRYDCEYEEVRQEWNRAIQKFPLVIVYCYTKWDVSNAIIWARKHCIEIRIRSGGHHYEGYSVGNGVLVIDISRMNCKLVSATKWWVVHKIMSKSRYPKYAGNRLFFCV